MPSTLARTLGAEGVKRQRGVGPDVEQADGATPVEHTLRAACMGWRRRKRSWHRAGLSNC